MSTTITRLYKTQQDANDAITLLRKFGFSDSEINCVPPSAADGGADLVAAITRGGVPASHAKVYAGSVAGGATLLTVSASYGRSVKATSTLARFNPLPSPVAEPDLYSKAEVGDMSLTIDSEPPAVLLDSNAYFTPGLPLRSSGKAASSVMSDGKPFLGGLMNSDAGALLPFPTVIKSKD